MADLVIPPVQETPVAPPAPEAAAPAAEAKPEADLSGLSKFLGEAVLGRKRAKANEEAKQPDPEPEAPDPEAEAEAEAAAAPQPAPAKPVVPARARAVAKKPEQQPAAAAATEVDYDRIGRAAGEGVGEALRKSEAARAKAPEPTLSAEEKLKLNTLNEMAEMLPDVYKGIGERFVSAIEKEKGYVAEWKKENPGKKFDPTSDEHDAFYAENDITYNTDTFQIAAGRYAAKEQSGSLHKELKQTQAELERDQRLRREEPVIAAEAKKAGVSFFKETGDPDFEGILPDGVNVDRAKVQELFAKDPEKANLFLRAASAAETEAAAAYRIMSGLESYDEKNPIHSAVNAAAVEVEDYMASVPRAERMDGEGRLFVPYGEFNKMSQAQKGKHWTVTPESVYPIFAYNHAQAAKKIFKQSEENFEKRLKARGYTKSNSPRTENQPVPAAVATPSARPTRPRSPSADVAPTPASGPSGKAPSANSGIGAFLQRNFGGS